MLALAATHEQAQAKLSHWREFGIPEEQIAAFAIVGDPDEVAEQVAAHLDAGLDGLVVDMPDPHDLETVALAGELLSRVIPRAACVTSG